MSGQRAFTISIAAALVAATSAGAWWLADQQAWVTTSDARVRARMVSISADVAGRIAAFPLSPGDPLETGAVIARLDDRRAQLSLAAATLELKALDIEIETERAAAALARDKSGSAVDSRLANLQGARADITAARALLALSEADYGRKQQLHAAGLIAHAALDRAGATLESARQMRARSEAALESGEASLAGAQAEAGEADLLLRRAEGLSLRAAALRQQIALLTLELEQHVVKSPIDGVVDEVFAEAGEHVAAGARIALAHSPSGMWIEANIKETDIRRVQAGAEVEVKLDAADGPCGGAVERIGATATSEFALIPNANPTGVFTKITQRVPVRVGIGGDCKQVRPGAMATVRIRAS